MKTIDPTTIERGAALLDKATWPEFEAFLKDTMAWSAKELLGKGLKTLLDANQRPRAIALWRKVAADYREAEPGETRLGATEMLRAEGIKELTPRQTQLAAAIYGAFVAQTVSKKTDLEGEALLMFFALAAAYAKNFENAASVLGVKLP